MKALIELNTGLSAKHERDILKSSGLTVLNTCVGSYNGTISQVFQIQLTDDRDLETLKLVGHTFEQESVLVIKPDQDALLLFLDSRNQTIESVGKWNKVSKKQALKTKNWTKIKGVFYVAA